MPTLVERSAARRATLVRRQPAKALTFPREWSDGAGVLLGTGTSGSREDIPVDFQAMVEGVFKTNGPIFACVVARLRIFTQARFQFQEFNSDSSGTRPGKLFGTDSLSILEKPWANAWTGTLLALMELDSSLAGNFYATMVADRPQQSPLMGRAAFSHPNRRIVRMRPDWVTILIDSWSGDPNALDAKVIAYIFHPPGPVENWVTLLPAEVVHYAPIQDPAARYRGMSWLTPVIRDIQADSASTEHKNATMKNRATPSLAVKVPGRFENTAFQAYVEKFRQVNEGAANAGKSIFLANGADAVPLTVDLKALDFAVVQAKGETRIATASGVHPTLLGFSEGLGGSSLNAGNFNAARRLTVDMTIRHLWQMAASSLQVFCPPPSNLTRLTYDDRDIPFLHEDIKDRADAFQVLVEAAARLTDAGWNPDAAIAAIAAMDLGLLKGEHSGLFSVQLQPAIQKVPQATTEDSNSDGPPSNNQQGANMAGVARSLNGNGASNGR